MTTDTIILRCTRPLMFGGQRVEPGQTLRVSPLDAVDLLASGRAALAHAADAEALKQAQRDDVARAIARAGRPWGGLQVSPPWQRAG